MKKTRKTVNCRAAIAAMIAMLAAPLLLSSESVPRDSQTKPAEAVDAATSVTIVAAGQIAVDGAIVQNYNISKATYSNANKRWEIKLKGAAKDFDFRDFVTVVTPLDDKPIVATTNSMMSKLLVYIMDANKNVYLKENFCFVVYQIKTTSPRG